MDWIQRIMNQTSSPSMKELLLRHCSILGSSIRICQRHTATGLELGTSKVQRYCGANEEFGGDVRRYDMTCISYGLQKIVHDTWHMVLLWIRCVMIWVGLCEITLWSKIKCAEHHSLARQVFLASKRMPTPRQICNRFDHVPAIEEMFTLASSTRRCLKARGIRGWGCCSDPSGHEICDVILIEACRQKMNQWAVPLVWVGSLHRKCTERSETVRLLQQAAESVLAVVGTGLACFAACWVDSLGFTNLTRFGSKSEQDPMRGQFTRNSKKLPPGIGQNSPVVRR